MENKILNEQDTANTSQISEEKIDNSARTSEERAEFRFDEKNQNHIIQLQNYVEIENLSNREDVMNKIMALSERHNEDFPELRKHFEEWKPVRKNLIKLLQRASDNLQFSHETVYKIRVFSSAADIFGTIVRGLNRNSSGILGILANIAMDYAPTLGFISLSTDYMISHWMHNAVKDQITRDQKCFEKITDWFQKNEELDRTIKNFFPYGIDKDIVMKIQKVDKFEEFQKIFASIVFSNAKINSYILKDKTFLGTAYFIANSEEGKLWLQKVILEPDPLYIDGLNCILSQEIQTKLKDPSIRKTELIYYTFNKVQPHIVPVPLALKLLYSLVTFVTAGTNVWFRSKSEESAVMKELSKKTEEEFKKIETVVNMLDRSKQNQNKKKENNNGQ